MTQNACRASAAAPRSSTGGPGTAAEKRALLQKRWKLRFLWGGGAVQPGTVGSTLRLADSEANGEMRYFGNRGDAPERR